MNWDTQLDSILHATDSNVAKIKQRLNTAGALSEVPEPILGSLSSRKNVYDMSAGTLQLSQSYTHSPHQAMTVEEATAINSQLDTQTQKMELLTQAVRRLERERQQQQQCILTLEEEVHRLRSGPRTLSDLTLESRMEELRQEIFNELRSLREQVGPLHGRGINPEQPSPTYLQQELAESKRILWQECKSLREEICHIKQDLRKQREDLLQQISDCQEVKRLQESSCKALEEVVSSHKLHSEKLKETKLENEAREQEVETLRTAVMNIEEEMKNLHIPWRRSCRGRVIQREQSSERLSASEDSASQLSLADISSEDDVSSPLDVTDSTACPSLSPASVTPEVKSTAAIDSADDLSSDLEGLSDYLPELSCSDL